MTSRKLIVFDFDGTLIDSQASLDKGLIEFSVMKGLPYDTVKMARGYIDPLKYDLGWGLPFDQQPAMFEEMGVYSISQMRDHGRFIPEFFPGAIDVLNELQEQYDLALVTARDRLTTEVVLNHHKAAGYFPHFRTFCCARERGYAIKPAPDALQCVLKDTKHNPVDVIVVGDTTSDILMASSAGAKSAAALWGIHPKERLETAKPTIMVDTIGDLPTAVNDLFNQ